jgi:protein-disulfide isomerase
MRLCYDADTTLSEKRISGVTEQPTPRDDTPRPESANQDFYIESNTPVRSAKPTEEPVMMLSGGMVNAVLIAITFLMVGVLIGQNLSPRGLTSQEAESIVRNVLIEASLLTETQSNAELVDDDPYIGAKDAPIVIVEFGDFQCRFCNLHFHQTLEPLLENYGPYIRYVYRDFATLTVESEPAAIAAECANRQGKFWEFHNEFYSNAEYLSHAFYLNLADQLGLDVDAFTACLSDPAALEEVQKDLIAGQFNGVSGTPGFLINGVLIRGAQPYPVFEKVIEREMNRLGISRTERPKTDVVAPQMDALVPTATAADSSNVSDPESAATPEVR